MGPPPPPPRPPAAFIGEGQSDFDLGVLGERFGARQVDGAARAVDAVGAPSALPAPWPSRRKKSVASIRTRPLVSPATVKPHRTDFANESSTDRRSAGLVLDERNVLVALHHQHARSDPLEARRSCRRPPVRDRGRCRWSRVRRRVPWRTGRECPGGGFRDRGCRCALPSTPGRSRRASASRSCAPRYWGCVPVERRRHVRAAGRGGKRLDTGRRKVETSARNPQETIIRVEMAGAARAWPAQLPLQPFQASIGVAEADPSLTPIRSISDRYRLHILRFSSPAFR